MTGIQIDPLAGEAYAGGVGGMEKMDDNESILAELRKISAWADMQRKMTKWSLLIGAVMGT